jgi:predicted tellurium resistance membrane protein TerC
MFDAITPLLSDPAAWLALVTLVVMEVVLGIDNLVFISILSNKLPVEQRARVRRIGIGLALIMRLALLSLIGFIVALVHPVFDLGLAGPLVEPDCVATATRECHRAFETSFSWRDLILIAGGLFLVWKATKEIHHTVDPTPNHDLLDAKNAVINNAGAAIVQIILLDLVFSVDSILTAVGMTDHVPIMMVAVIIAVTVMLLASTPLANFIEKNPTVVMLALGFLLMIGMVLIADGFGVHVPKGYIYAAMAFSGLVEGLNMMGRSSAAKKQAALDARQATLNRAETAEPGV